MNDNDAKTVESLIDYILLHLNREASSPTAEKEMMELLMSKLRLAFCKSGRENLKTGKYEGSCGFCGKITVDAIGDGFEPDYYTPDGQWVNSITCPACAEKHLSFNASGDRVKQS